MVSIQRLSQTQEDHQYLRLALEVSLSSDDPKGKINRSSAVGAVIVGDEGVVASSANVLPPSLSEPGIEIVNKDRYFVIEHAERASIFKALISGKKLDNTTIYCTRIPCADCARAIIWVGIKRAVFGSSLSNEDHWLESQQAGLKMMGEAGVKVRLLDTD